MLKPITLYDDDCDIDLFGSYSPEMTKTQKAIDLLTNMQDLKYIDFNSEIQTMQFTNPGLAYLKHHGDTIKYYIQKYNLTLDSFGPMTGYMDGLFRDLHKYEIMSLSPYPILDCNYTVNELGEIVEDMNTIEFSEKAPGDMEA